MASWVNPTLSPVVASELAPVAQVEQPTEGAEFTPVVRYQAIEVPSQHPERKARLEACRDVENVAGCMITAADLDGNGDVSVTEHVAVAGKTRHIYEVQLEPGGPFVENPDLNGNGSWDTEDQFRLDRLLQAQP
ncbi:hypothetical protein IQ254_18540 [Nodosilinea sp. LEGE 07088]|uniref:hypothetical protein n=1 Tax=Nodosilinea sp. LEGE 07088 TaxID=2777968 RepID=UPI001880F564|nr:hypothetical protein [Nodosilinea sp. LEGE 07088]MBE9139169.1 hypothetical protein [Nodosilinea sp. LEGE 07088]